MEIIWQPIWVGASSFDKDGKIMLVVAGVHNAPPGQASAPSWNHAILDHSALFRTGSKVVLEDNFGSKILARKGRVPQDVDLKF